MSRARALRSAYRALNKKFRATRKEQIRVERSDRHFNQRSFGAARAASGKAKSVASASINRRSPVPALSIETRNAIKIGRRQMAAMHGGQPRGFGKGGDSNMGLQGVRRRAVDRFGRQTNPAGVKKSIKKKRRS